ncbi:hypothetical protein ACWGNF_09810 [Streptomyces sp. NPDC055808]
MSADRHPFHGPLRPLARGAEVSMPPSARAETRDRVDLTVTLSGGLFIALLMLPIVMIHGIPGPGVVPALSVFITAAGRGSYVSYRRVPRT